MYKCSSLGFLHCGNVCSRKSNLVSVLLENVQFISLAYVYLLTKRFHNSNGRYFDTMLLKIIKWFENVQNGYKNFDNIGFLGLCVKNGCTEDEAGG